MEVKIARETRAALEADTALRILIRTKFKLDSRHSQPVIARAENLAKALTSAMLRDLQRKAARVIIQMIMVHLLDARSYALVCFDLFFEECNERARSQQPVHEVSRRGKVYHVRRNKTLDAEVAKSYVGMYRIDKGPRPYFADCENPPHYDEGVRLEKRLDGSDPQDDLPDDSEEDEPKEGELKEDGPKEDELVQDEPKEDRPKQDEPKEDGLKGNGPQEGELKGNGPEEGELKGNGPEEGELKGDGPKNEEQVEGNKPAEDGYA